jgi:hypothetical protein
MAQAERVENLIIGSGEAGKWLAWELGKSARTVVVERRWIGGSCPNINYVGHVRAGPRHVGAERRGLANEMSDPVAVAAWRCASRCC